MTRINHKAIYKNICNEFGLTSYKRCKGVTYFYQNDKHLFFIENQQPKKYQLKTVFIKFMIDEDNNKEIEKYIGDQYVAARNNSKGGVDWAFNSPYSYFLF